MSKKFFAVLGALAVLYAALWFAFPFRTYNGYASEAKGDKSIEVQKPGMFSFKGSIFIRAEKFSGLVIKPGVFSGYEIYVFLSGTAKDYMIPVDEELIPFEPVGEECEILLDESREALFACLEKAEKLLGQ